MRIAITGSTGLIGSALVDALRDRGDDVVRLVRRAPRADDEVRWDPTRHEMDDPGAVDAVVNLAGAPVSRRWTPSNRRLIHDSRVNSTRTVARWIAAQTQPPALINGSAVGYYGDRPQESLDEQSGPGEGFLADVTRDWEAATQAAAETGARVALVRTGLVMAPGGGAIQRTLPLIKLGLGGPLGPGTQVWPWISLPDEVGAICHVLDHDIAGPVNLAAPAHDTQLDVVRAVAAELSRPAIMPAPGLMLKLALGDFADDIMASQHVVPRVLCQSGYCFQHPDLAALAAWLV